MKSRVEIEERIATLERIEKEVFPSSDIRKRITELEWILDNEL